MTAVDIVIRDIDGQAEMRAVEVLQKEVWGLPDLDVVPLTQLVAAKASGGVVIGAFDGDILAGFAYGFAGYEEGRVTHHSHMLAVKPDYRNFNVGYKLKLAQRERVLTQGITEMTWTFDPLQSRNAHFNFNRLGILADRYLVDFYGTHATSFLHRNGTDRLWVRWPLTSRRVIERLASNQGDLEAEQITALVELGEKNGPLLNDLDLKNAVDRASIEIPADIIKIEEQNPKMATDWRRATRSAFSSAFTAGYVAVEFVRGSKSGRYILSRKTAEISRL